MKKLYYLLLLFLFYGCSNSEDVFVQEDNKKTAISIYLVKEEEPPIATEQANIGNVQLEETPWLKDSEIEFYDWSSHIFYLKAEKRKSHLAGRNFVIKADDERLFAGVFFPPWMSSIPQIPSIIAADEFMLPDDVVAFGQFGYLHSGGLNGLESFKSSLIDAGLFMRGIVVDLIELEKNSSSELEYTFKITNKDLMNIYVLDINKMGNERFHYFTNGIFLKDGDTFYYPNNKSLAKEQIQPGWYKKLRPGEWMTRTAVSTGFTSLPTGSVTCFFTFPGSRVETGNWKKHDGRIWLGRLPMGKEMRLK